MSGPVPSTSDVVVIGAGVIGAAVAFELSKTGRSVTVIDKGPAAGAGSTSSSSAIVRFNYSTRDAMIVAWEAVHMWRRWPAHLGVSDESGHANFHQTGMLAIDKPGAEEARRGILALFEDVGVPYEVLATPELRRRFPCLDVGRYYPPRPVADEAFWDEPSGELDAYYTPDAGFIDDPQLAAHNLMVAAQASGARFCFGETITEIRRNSDGGVAGIRSASGAEVRAPIVMNCAGPFSSAVNRMAGVLDDFNVSTRALRQEVHVAPAPDAFGLGTGGAIVADPDLGTYFRPQPGGSILVGGVEPDCDPMVWVDDADVYNDLPTVEVWEAQTLRLARRLPELKIPSRPTGLAALYDVTPDWVPIYDTTNLPGFFVAIGSSGNQFKNAPMSGRIMAALVAAADAGQDHDSDPVQLHCEHTGHTVDLSHFSRRRQAATTSRSVLG